MTDLLEGRILPESYRARLFAMPRNRSVLNEEADVIIQKAYGDADDYYVAVSLPYTIGESELRERVAKSVKELERLTGAGE